jgi:Peptidase family M23
LCGKRTMPLVLRLLGLVALSSALSFAFADTAWPYPWPVKPFHKQHPIRGSFGDPRTVYVNTWLTRFEGSGAFSFHQGVDISAPDGTPVYPVASGVVHYLDAATLRVHADHNRTFQYFHLVPIVREAQHVVAGRTVLGYIQAPFGHVHLTEIDGTHAINPLQKGHLSPYSDHTRPTIRGALFSNETGPLATPLEICGRIEIAADAFDTPPVRVPGDFGGLPVAPALVRWKITKPGKDRAVRWRTAADFRSTLPPNNRFFDVYARGTYQNAPRFGKLQYLSRPGRYLFVLAAGFDTTSLPNGAYELTVFASDERGNRTSFHERFSVSNTGGVCSGSLSRKRTDGAQP